MCRAVVRGLRQQLIVELQGLHEHTRRNMLHCRPVAGFRNATGCMLTAMGSHEITAPNLISFASLGGSHHAWGECPGLDGPG